MSTTPDIAKAAPAVPDFRVARSTRMHKIVLIVSVFVVSWCWPASRGGPR